jgi:4-amino-4-deoxy-L-arabinose transferase-like glycosyltransferase
MMDRRQYRIAVAMLAAGCLAHLLLAGAFHLSTDEAHYALYALHLDWSYFDHPPLVGWVQWPWVTLGGGDLALRLVPMLCWLLSAVGIVAVTLALYEDAGADAGKAAGAALLLFVLSPIPHLLGIALVPDSLLMPLCCAVMWLCIRLVRGDGVNDRRYWLGLGLALGLAGLAKYSAVFLAVGAAIVLLRAHGWRLLRRLDVWLAAVLALACVTPVLVWNATHDWASFSYQFRHAAGNSDWEPGRVVVFLLVQNVGYGMLLVAGTVAGTLGGGDGLRGSAPARRARSFAGAFVLPILLLLTFSSGRGSTLPHWSAFAWVAACPVAAPAIVDLWRSARSIARFGAKAAVAFQLAVCLACAGLMLSAGAVSESAAQARSAPGELTSTAPLNPFADLWGWDQAAEAAIQLAHRYRVADLAVMNWSLASRIAWYARPMPVKVVRRHFDQFDAWFGSLQPGDSVLLVDWSLLSFAPPQGAGQFSRCAPVGTMPVVRGRRQVAHFNFLLCSNWGIAARP